MTTKPSLSTIWKFEVGPDGILHDVPVIHRILSVGVGFQNNTAVVWALVDPTAEAEVMDKQLTVVGTGWRQDLASKRFVGTVQFPNGLVFHFFDDED